MTRALRQIGFLVFCFSVTVFPILLLFIKTDTGFTSDWYNNLWMVGQFSHSFIDHLSFPSLLNANEMVGITFPVFYGHLLYPAIGLLGSWLSPNQAMRTACVLLYVIQFAAVYLACLQVTRRQGVSLIASILMVWAIYPLTNLYTRSAIAEFAGVSLLYSSLSFWFLFVGSKSVQEKLRYGFYFAFLFAFIFGVHPITAFYGSVCLVFGVLGAVYVRRPSTWSVWKGYVAVLGGVGLLIFLTSGSWLEALREFKPYLAVANQLGQNTYYSGIDHFWFRILPFPFDHRSLVSGIATPGTYLDSQINIPLFLLVIGCFYEKISSLGKDRNWRNYRVLLKSPATQLALFFMGLSFFILKVSVSPSLGDHFISVLKNFQIAYRMVSYCNLFLFLSLYFAFQIPVSPNFKKTERDIVISTALQSVVISISFCAVLAKLLHGTVVWSEASRFDYPHLATQERHDFVTVPKSFYSIANYAISKDVLPLDGSVLSPRQALLFEVNTQVGHFGETSEIETRLEPGQWIRTNVYPFPWNEILENGKPIQKDRLRVGGSPSLYAVLGDRGGTAKYTFVQRPDSVWLFLRSVSMMVFWMSFGIAIGLFVYSIEWTKGYLVFRSANNSPKYKQPMPIIRT